MLVSASMIFQLLYSSTATQAFWPDDLFNLVEKSRSRNARRAITGMLLFHEGQFMQLLEGPEKAVRDCFAIIKRDPRHTSVTVLLMEERQHRDFPEWTMGFERLEHAWSLPPAWSTILEEPLSPAATSQNPSAAKELILSFQLGLPTSPTI
jgi:Sensors of blue-light using FAD